LGCAVISVRQADGEAIEAFDATLSALVEISEWCEAVPAGMESMGLLIKVLHIVLSPTVCGAVVDRYIGALAVLARMALEIVDPGSDPPQPSYLVDPGCDPPLPAHYSQVLSAQVVFRGEQVLSVSAIIKEALRIICRPLSRP
jgi:hypothetical protein